MTDDRNPTDPERHEGEPDDLAPVDPLDERLSAELDGELEGVTNGVATARADTRRDELTAARDLLAVPPPPLDDITRRRLLRDALAAGSPERRRDLRRLNRVGAAAAVLAIVAVGGLTLKAIGDSGTSDSKSATAGDAKGTGTTVAGVSPTASDLGEVSEPLELKRRVESALDAPAAAPTTLVPEKSTAPTNARGFTAAAVPIGSCDATVRVPPDARPTILGKATYEGAPAVVLVARDGARTLIFVVASDDCRLLTSQFFGG